MERDNSIDIARVVSCFLVVMTHVTAYWNYKFQPVWETVNFYNSLSRCAVPIFVMISGILLIKDNIDPLTFYRKKLPKAVCVLFSWSLFYYIFYNKDISSLGFIVKIFTGQAMYHLWYLYFLIGMYFMTPFISFSYYKMNEKQRFFVFMIILALFQLNVFKSLTGISIQSKFNLDSMVSLTWYMFVGKLIYDSREKVAKSTILFLTFLSSVFSTAAFTSIYSNYIGRPEQAFLDNFALNTFIAACSLFLLCTKINNKFIVNLSNKISGYTFAIYCIHPAILIPLKQNVWELSWTNPMIYFLPLVCVFMFTSSLIVAAILKRIPIIRYVC
ncbi:MULTISPECIES: acyltransferase family protein [Hafnia]|uniref:acyltransferase n=1 Tax=Hafnia TaxID=568 RepID=UPI000BBA8250